MYIVTHVTLSVINALPEIKKHCSFYDAVVNASNNITQCQMTVASLSHPELKSD